MKKFLRVSQIVPNKIPVSRSTWWKWVSEGNAPQPIKLGPKTTVWDADEIDNYISNQSPANCASVESGNGDE